MQKRQQITGILRQPVTVEWETPPEIFAKLDAEFKFTLDPCATNANAKCSKYCTVRENGLVQSWASESVFMNPPYGRDTALWMRKAYSEAKNGALVVCLVFARTDVGWWHAYAMKGEVRFVRGRIRFSHCGVNAPSPSAIVVFRPHLPDPPTRSVSFAQPRHDH